MSNFIQNVIEKAKIANKIIVLPESNDIRTIKAANILSKEKIAKVILLWNENDIKSTAWEISLEWITILDHINANNFEEYCQEYFELRKNKWISLEQARETLTNPLYFGVMMVKKWEAHGMVAWAINSTANVLKPALQIIKTAPGTTTVSSFFVMDVPNCDYWENGLFVFSDCGLMENPNSEELAEIANSSARSFESLIGKESRVAMLSYSTYWSANSELTQKVVNATKIVKEKYPELKVDWELQADAAIIESVGKSKAPNSEIAWIANTLIFPDLNSWNISYKLVQRLAKAEAYWPITQWLAKPVNDLSRWCSAEDIVGVVAITCLQ